MFDDDEDGLRQVHGCLFWMISLLIFWVALSFVIWLAWGH
jgi:hypothetical protein